MLCIKKYALEGAERRPFATNQLVSLNEGYTLTELIIIIPKTTMAKTEKKSV